MQRRIGHFLTETNCNLGKNQYYVEKTDLHVHELISRMAFFCFIRTASRMRCGKCPEANIDENMHYANTILHAYNNGNALRTIDWLRLHEE